VGLFTARDSDKAEPFFETRRVNAASNVMYWF
jgi:hypothetical protein